MSEDGKLNGPLEPEVADTMAEFMVILLQESSGWNEHD